MAAAVPGCGRKGPVRPPELLAPARIEDLQAVDTPQGVVLSWSRPRTYADGTRMDDLGGFAVERAESDGPFQRIASLPVSDRERFRKIRRFRFLDTAARPGRVYRYRVVSFTTDRYASAPSNAVEIARQGAGEEPTPSGAKPREIERE